MPNRNDIASSLIVTACIVLSVVLLVIGILTGS